jgi:hypothetical protein
MKVGEILQIVASAIVMIAIMFGTALIFSVGKTFHDPTLAELFIFIPGLLIFLYGIYRSFQIPNPTAKNNTELILQIIWTIFWIYLFAHYYLSDQPIISL